MKLPEPARGRWENYGNETILVFALIFALWRVLKYPQKEHFEAVTRAAPHVLSISAITIGFLITAFSLILTCSNDGLKKLKEPGLFKRFCNFVNRALSISVISCVLSLVVVMCVSETSKDEAWKPSFVGQCVIPFWFATTVVAFLNFLRVYRLFKISVFDSSPSA